VFVDELSEVPDGSTVIFSAHGVSLAVHEEGRQRGLRVFDATCPLVTKVHLEVSQHAATGRECILIGHKGHPEVEGTMGQYDAAQGGRMYLVETTDDVRALQVDNPEELAFVTQTTLSVDDTERVISALRKRFPAIRGPRKDDICYATQNRQDAVKQLAGQCDVMLVVGSPNSSNSNRLRELAGNQGIPAYLIDEASQIKPDWLVGKQAVGITAGASAPEDIVTGVVEQLRDWGAETVEESQGRREPVTFSLPGELKRG
jgi:4-hydroxy-3-methylbut-2-enyl diphosphate reductase